MLKRVLLDCSARFTLEVDAPLLFPDQNIQYAFLTIAFLGILADYKFSRRRWGLSKPFIIAVISKVYDH